MPYLDAGTTLVDKNTFTVSMIDFAGDKCSVSLSGYPATVTDAELLAFAQALGALTNAGVYGYSNTKDKKTAPTEAVVFDEAYANAGMKAIMVFQDLSTLKIIQIGIPAPDSSIFQSDNNTVNPTGDVLTFITATQTVLNKEGAEYFYQRGYRAGRTRQIPRSNATGIRSEPGVGDKPGDAPAV